MWNGMGGGRQRHMVVFIRGWMGDLYCKAADAD